MAEKDRNFRLRDKEIRVKLTEEELQFAKDKANYCGLSMSDYIREIIFKGVVIHLDTGDIEKLSYELNKIGTNINQIVRLANETHSVGEDDLISLLNEFDEIKDSIYTHLYGIKK